MPIERQAYDGGQEQRLKLGEVETIQWKLDPLDQPGELGSASVAIEPDVGLSATQVSIDTTAVAFQFSATSLGKYDAVVSLHEVGGDLRKHLLVIEVFS